jgi:hypothetical protein
MNLAKAPTNVQVLKALGAALGIAGVCHGAALASGTKTLAVSLLPTLCEQMYCGGIRKSH